MNRRSIVRARPFSVLLFGALLTAGLALAEPPNRNGSGARRGPPQVAIDACSGAAEQSACAFEGRRGEDLSGSCELMRDDLVCVPEGHERRERRDVGSADRSDEDL